MYQENTKVSIYEKTLVTLVTISILLLAIIVPLAGTVL